MGQFCSCYEVDVVEKHPMPERQPPPNPQYTYVQNQVPIRRRESTKLTLQNTEINIYNTDDISVTGEC